MTAGVSCESRRPIRRIVLVPHTSTAFSKCARLLIPPLLSKSIFKISRGEIAVRTWVAGFSFTRERFFQVHAANGI
jgi:hypothetical protein